MADIVSAAVRSRMMAGIRGRNTKPELMLRKALFARGFRYRINKSSLPGKPDIVFPKHRAVLFVHGCFWHGHECSLFRWPGTREQFWKDKINANRLRDQRNVADLICAGWRVGAVHECSLRGPGKRELAVVTEICSGWIRGDRPTLEVAGRE